MRSTSKLRAVIGLATLSLAGCSSSEPPEPPPAPPRQPVQTEARKALVGPNVWLEVTGRQRRVVISAEVCLRQGPLEVLLCRKPSKEHESILTAAVDGRTIHQALTLAGAKEGAPVQFTPTYKPAHGTPIQILVRYEHQGQRKSVDARSWIRNAKTGKELAGDWVFAGSRLIPNPVDKDQPPIYLANTDGYLIGVSNFESALLDVSIRSPKEDADRLFEAWTERIPPVGTPCSVILEPVAKPAKP